MTETEAGDKEIMLASEEVTRRNVQAAVDYSNETRVLVRGLVERVEDLSRMLLTRDQDIALIRQQIAMMQAELYRGGTA